MLIKDIMIFLVSTLTKKEKKCFVIIVIWFFHLNIAGAMFKLRYILNEDETTNSKNNNY